MKKCSKCSGIMYDDETKCRFCGNETSFTPKADVESYEDQHDEYYVKDTERKEVKEKKEIKKTPKHSCCLVGFSCFFIFLFIIVLFIISSVIIALFFNAG